jgi:hypothetical protein
MQGVEGIKIENARNQKQRTNIDKLIQHQPMRGLLVGQAPGLISLFYMMYILLISLSRALLTAKPRKGFVERVVLLRTSNPFLTTLHVLCYVVVDREMDNHHCEPPICCCHRRLLLDAS